MIYPRELLRKGVFINNVDEIDRRLKNAELS